MLSRSQANNTEFNKSFRALAISLRDEILVRLPTQQTNLIPALEYGMLAGVDPVSAVAVHLEKLAKLLP